LLRNYNQAVNVYSELVSKLNWYKRPKFSPKNAESFVINRRDLLDITEEWRVKAETELKTLDEHVKMHGCGTETAVQLNA